MGELRNVVEALFEVEARGEADVAAQLYAPDVEFKGPMIEVHGRDGMKELVESSHRAFPDMKREIITAAEEGDTIAVQIRSKGTHLGPLGFTGGEIPATGRPVDTESAIFIRVENGLVKSWHTFYDGRILMQQLGLAGVGG